MELTKLAVDKILATSTENIALFVATNRLFNSNKEATKQCMIELMKRQAQGDAFDFVSYIDNVLKSNKINLNLEKLSSVKRQVSNIVASAILDIKDKPKQVAEEEDNDEGDVDFDEELFQKNV